MSRKPKKGYFVKGHFVAEGSELDLQLKAELKGTPGSTKTDLKRESDALQTLGGELLTLRADLMARLELPEKLVDALHEAARITNFEGKRRQMQFVGKLMRKLDEDTIAAIHAALDEQRSGSAAERLLLAGSDRRDMVESLQPLLIGPQLAQLQQRVLGVHAAEPLLNYVQDLLEATRSGRWFLQGLSPRAGIALMRAAKAQALIEGRDYVAPDDVQAILPQTVAHRLVPVGDAGRGAVEQVRAMLQAVPLP